MTHISSSLLPIVFQSQSVEYSCVGCEVGVSDLPVQLDHLLQLTHGPDQIPLSAVDHRHVEAGHCLAGAVPDLPPDGQGGLVVPQRLHPVTEPVVDTADVVQGGGLAGTVPDLPPDGQSGLEVPQRLHPVTEPVMDEADVVQGDGLARSPVDEREPESVREGRGAAGRRQDPGLLATGAGSARPA